MSIDPSTPPSLASPSAGLGSEPGAATGIGSWPGTQVRAAIRATFDELGDAPQLPYLPELPARGPGADLIGRTAALLVDLPVDLQPSGWRLVDHPGRDVKRAKSFLGEDLDVLAEVADGYRGRFKLQVAGPWTLASALWLPRLERAVVDPGAVRDLIGSLAEGITQHVQEVSRLLPGVEIVVQLDEPGLPAVLTGALPTASGFGRLRAVQEPTIVEGLQAVLEAAVEAGAVGTVLHSCAADLPIEMLVKTGAGALSLDLARLRTAGWEQIAIAVEGGTQLWAGAIDTSDAVLAGTMPRPDTVADAVWTPWRTLGLDVASAGAVVITPACGLAGASPAAARSVLKLAKSAAAVLAERASG
ncbi:MAG TPA: methionine synthase [Kineosporiaceae bacterium]|nr:methionine synthase [Kineosporiaceae bacterium]